MKGGHNSESRDFVSKYETIRSILREMFLFCCFTVDDFKAKGISPSKYNQLIRKLTGFIDWKYVKKQRVYGKEAIYFTSNMFDVDYNYLLNTLTMKSFTDNEAAISLKIMQILTQNSTTLTQNEILDIVEEDLDNTTLYRILRTLVEIGYVDVDEKSTPRTYSLSVDIFEGLDAKVLQRLMQFVDMMRNVVYPSTCGNFLFESINLYRKSKGISKKYKNPFQLKHNKHWYVLEDEILWKLLRAINGGKTISLDYEHNENGTSSTRHYENICPIKIVAEERYGRRYLSIHGDEDPNKSAFLRLDKISKVEIKAGNVTLCRTKLLEEHREKMKQSVMGISPRMSSDTIKEVSLIVPHDSLKYVQVELNPPSVQAMAGGKYRAILQVSSVDELKPFLRRFIGKIEVENSKQHGLREILQEELAEWRKLYGIVSRTEEQVYFERDTAHK